MKKWVLITGITILIIAGVLVVHRVKNNMPKVLPNGTVVYDFTKQRQLRASKILYEYILEEYAEDSKRYHDIDYIKTHYGNIKKYAETEFLITPKRVYAFEYDLNNDGKNEIIGFIKSNYDNAPAGNNLRIMQNINKKYCSITGHFTGFGPEKKIYILPHYTNGYKDIVFHGSKWFSFYQTGIKYSKKGYYTFIHLFNE